ncbi:MAG: ferric reductase-like transmembrane domain-containing protein [Chloroflexi bacterium]|nr:ferric reductase-like transmembrane domain-containing protein [Chloroflexota bacterium]MDA1147168.1 ferric reductase-like transmembrane domain-containing protein [Chloroflexota bacterium]
MTSSKLRPATIVALAVIAIAATRALPAFFALWDTEAPLQWWTSRATGFVAYVALWASMVLGLMISARGLDGVINRKTVLELHQQWTLAAVIALGFHIAAIVGDPYVDMSWRSALVPGSSAYMPGAVALGAIATWGVALLALSSWLQRRINYTVWRVIHTTAFGTFLVGLVHGVVSGTDSGTIGAQALYVATAALLVGGVIFRVLYFPTKPSRARAPA